MRNKLRADLIMQQKMSWETACPSVEQMLVLVHAQYLMSAVARITRFCSAI
jgi:hypothetical protein